MLLSQWITAATTLVSQDENWLGGMATFNTTEGNDFWLTFMNNATFDPTHPDNKKIKFEMKVGVSAREAMEIHIAVNNNVIKTLNLAAGETQIFELDRDTYAPLVYLLSSEKNGYKGVHVYASEKDKDKYFSCFCYNRHGDPAGSLRDVSMILPTRSLGKEYYIQTNSEDFYSSQFAIVATENGTNVTVTPTEETFNEKPANTPFTVTLSKGEAYLIVSRKHKDEDPDYTVDMSGSKICADKPIAVFNGNQETSVPINSVLKRDFATEQSLPIIQWGTDFYLALMKHTKEHYFRLTAAYDETTVSIYTGSSTPSSTITLDAGKSSDIQYISKAKSEYKVSSSKPVICYSYTPSLHKNMQEIDGVEFNLGNTSNAMMPSWSHRAKEMNFFTLEMDPEKVMGTDSPQEYYVYLVTRTADINKITVDGVSYASSFNKFASDESMAYANIEVGNATGYHNVSTTGDGFVGMVYALSQAQGYHYTLGYTPDPYQDSLFITNNEALMSEKSYDMDSLDGHGWYQRQWDEWLEGKERLDTAVVCDSSFVYWTLESPKERPVKQIEWSLYDITDGERTLLEGFPYSVNPAETETKHRYEHQFILPEEPMEDRHQFFEYELEAILHRDQAVCGDEDLDTFKTVTRVTRIFNDTIWRAICIGDSLFFFNDSLYTQGDLSKHEDGKKDSTRFVATKTTEPNDGKWVWKVNSGQYEFQRHYLSQFGCDSLITLELFVCDTFRFVDTIHLCENQDTLYHETVFRGSKYNRIRPGYTNKQIRDKESVQIVEFKAKDCGCLKDDLLGKYLTKDGKEFLGCDSLYELHLYIHQSYEVPIIDTLDYKEFPDSVYHWYVERDGKKDSILIDKNTKGMSWNASAKVWIGYFGDTIRTKTCSECNGGNPRGCDSINSLMLYIPPVYYFDTTITWCRMHYNWSKHDVDIQDFRWKGHHHDIIYTQTGHYYDSCQSRYKADSIYHLYLIYSEAPEPLYDLYRDTVCFDSLNLYHWTSKDGLIDIDTIRQDILGTSYYVDESRCDTVYALELLVLPTYFEVDSVKMTQEQTYTWYADGKTYGGQKTEQPYDVLVNTSEFIVEIDTLTAPIGTYRCDSIRKLVLHVGNVYRDTVQAFACGEDDEFVWMETRSKYMGEDQEPFERMTITRSQLPAPNTVKIYEQKFKTVLNDDSVFYLELYRAPSYFKDTAIYVCQDTVNLFTWDHNHQTHILYDQQTGEHIAATDLSLKLPGDYYYIDSLETDSFQCDSVWRLRLHIDPIFFRDTTVKVCQFDEYRWRNNDQDSVLDAKGKKVTAIPTDHTGDFRYDVMFHTVHGCDSIWHLTLHVDTVYLVPVEAKDTFMCDKDSIVFVGKTYYGANSPNKPKGEPGIAIPEGELFMDTALVDFVHSSLGCDSAVEYHVTVYKTYSDTVYDRVCQPSEGRDSLYHWLGHDTVWDVHNSRFIPADSIPRYGKGDTTYLYIDSLRTTTCTMCDKVKGGCDSLFYLFLTIDSTYHFYDTVHICENERYTWQKRTYAGDSVPDITTSDIVRKPGVYHERVKYDGVRTCDSIYYLELYVHPVYHTVIRHTFCDNDTSKAAHIFEFKDSQGYYEVENVRYMPHDPVPEADSASTHYDPAYRTLEHHMKTIDGCDSIVTVYITIMPTYEFSHQVSICHSGTYEWRGKEYMVAGHYEDKYYTAEGNCDSVFTFDLFIKPVHITVVYDTLCDNDTYWFRDTIRYVDAMGRDREAITEYPVWSPGDPRPKPYVETVVKSMPPDVCDSLIYRYYLTICNTYNYETDATLCSGKPFSYTFDEEVTHVWESTAFEYDTNVYVIPFDTLFTDSLLTVMGCDSIFKLYAHVMPSYRHIEYDTICENATLTWRDTVLADLEIGDYIIRDSLYTQADGCDSIFELQLFVRSKYYTETRDTVCADDVYLWRDHRIEHAALGDTLVYDSLLSTFGCDSVFHLYLTVVDTTYEIRVDSICYGDTFFIAETGHFYTEAGHYKDTTLNDWGCRHFIYTQLASIPPTVPTLWAEDPMCHGETAFDLYYTYTSHQPIAFSLYFDSIGRSMGFEDMEDIAITSYTDPMVISVPIPYRGDDPTQYPRPDNYSVRLVLDNGICRHKESNCFHDSTFLMSYPKWITEQRFGDLIALLNEKNNGGYVWTEYQWYQGDTKLEGQTQPYLYLPSGLTVGEMYYVQLTRDGDSIAFPTCPIIAVADPNSNRYAPTMGYLSVVPTCVVTANPTVTILSRKDGTYRITTSEGHLVSEGVFRADATTVQVPSTTGMYIVQLWSNDTPEEPYRAIKIVVREQCEICATSF